MNQHVSTLLESATSFPACLIAGNEAFCQREGWVKKELVARTPISCSRYVQIALLLLTLFLAAGNGQAQTCNVTDYLYLNDVTPAGGYVHKLKLNTNITATEIYSSGTNPWFPAGGILDTPHGLGQDLNGNLYIGQTASGPIAKIKCNGTVVNSAFINDGGFNIVSKDGYLFVNSIDGNRINRYSLCDGSNQGYIRLSGVSTSAYSFGNEQLVDWGMEIDPNGTFYVSAGFNVLANDKNTYLYRFLPTDADFTAHTLYTANKSTGVGVSLKPGTGTNGISDRNDVWGITHDPAGNIYLVVRDWENTSDTETWVLKFDSNFNLVDSIVELTSSATGGIEGARGIVYYAPWDRLLIAGGPDGDCVAKIRPSDMVYVGALAPNEPGQTPKTLRIASEACPTAAALTVDTTMCNVQVGDKVFLQNIIGTCKAPICGGTWTASSGNAGITFNACDLSFTVTNVAIGCGKFTLTNVGGTCGNFTITVNVDFANVTAPVIAGNQTVCAGTDTPASFTTTTAATGSNTIKYQWQKSTASCTAGFTNIANATASTYTPTVLTQTTYYRVVATVDGSCSTPLGSCADTSNCVTVITKVCCAKPVVSVTPGTCNPATNQYSISGTISLTNASAGTATITDGTRSTTVAIAAAATSVAYSLTGLTSGTNSHTVTVSLPGCGTSTATYTAPASCTVAPCALNVVVTPGTCNSATNQYSISGTVSLTSAVAATMTITDGLATITVAVAANQTSVTYTLSGFTSDGATHTVVATLPGCGSDNATYVAPASCTVCTVSLTTSTLPGGQVGTAYSRTLVTSGGTTPYTYVVSTGTLPAGLNLNATTGVISGTPTAPATSVFSIKVTDAKSCTDVASLTIVTAAMPVCSLDLLVTPGACNSATNQYSISGTVGLTNPTAGNLVITDGAKSTTLTITASTTSVTYSLTGLTSGSGSHTVIASLSGCGTDNAVYTAPASCTVAPPAIAVVVGAPVCNTATNNYTATGTVSLTNSPAGSLTITDNGTSVTVITVTASTTSVSYSLTGLSGSTPPSHTVVASLGTTTASTTYATPVSCTVCSTSITTSALTNGQVGTAYSQTLTASGGTTPYVYSVSAGTLPAGLSLNGATGVISGTPTGTATSNFTVKVTDSKSCSDAQPLTITVASLPVCSLTATATPGTCNSATNQYTVTGTVSSVNAVINSASPQTLTVSVGSANAVVTLTGNGPVSYTLSGLNSDGLTKTVTVLSSATACGNASVTYAAPASCTVAPCGVALIVTPGLCSTATNAYVLSGTITATNVPTSGTLTITSGAFSPRSLTLPAANTASSTFSYSGLVSNGQTYTITASYSDAACAPVSKTYTAPASCSVSPVCSISAVVTAGVCNSATNTFSTTAVVTLTNPTVGILTITDGPASQTFATTAVTTATFTAVFAGITSDGTSHTVTAALPTCGTLTRTYTAPASCSVAPICSLSATVTAGLCASATNTYSATALVAVNNPAAGTLTVSDGGQSITFVTTSAGSATFVAVFSSLLSDGLLQNVTVSLPGCSSTTATYTAPASCTVTPVCNLSLTATGSACNPTTNQYVLSGSITLTNSPVSQTLTLTDGSYVRSLTANAGTTTISFSYTSLQSDGLVHTVTLVSSASTCGVASTTYTAPASCTTAPLCSVSAVVTAGLCSTATNTYSSTVLVTMTNPTAGILTVLDGTRSVTFTVPATVGTVTTSAIFIGLPSDGSVHPISVSLSGCSGTSTTYAAPASCTVCSSTLVSSSLPRGKVDKAYSATLVATGGTAPYSFSVSGGSLPTGLVLNPVTGLISGTPVISGSFPTTITITDASGCSVRVPLTVIQIDPVDVCALAVQVTPGLCQSATNQYSISGTVSLTSAIAGTLTITDGTFSTSVAVSASTTSVAYSLSGLSSGSGSHTVTASLSGCGLARVVYAAPVSCSMGSPTYAISKVVDQSRVEKGGIVTYTISLTNTSSVTGTNLLITDTFSGTGLSYLNSGTASVGTFSYAGVQAISGMWSISALAGGQVATLRLQAVTTEEGVHYNTVTGPDGSTAQVCTSVPAHVCEGIAFEYELTAPVLSGTYQWLKDGQPIAGATSATYSVTAAGKYSLSTISTAGCPDGSCCPFEVIADAAPSLTALAQSVSCNAGTALANGAITLVGSNSAAVSYNVSLGSVYTTGLLPADASLIGKSAGAVLLGNLANPAGSQTYTVRVFSASGCYQDVVVTLNETVCECPAVKCAPYVIRKTKSGGKQIVP